MILAVVTSHQRSWGKVSVILFSGVGSHVTITYDALVSLTTPPYMEPHSTGPLLWKWDSIVQDPQTPPHPDMVDHCTGPPTLRHWTLLYSPHQYWHWWPRMEICSKLFTWGTPPALTSGGYWSTYVWQGAVRTLLEYFHVKYWEIKKQAHYWIGFVHAIKNTDGKCLIKIFTQDAAECDWISNWEKVAFW